MGQSDRDKGRNTEKKTETKQQHTERDREREKKREGERGRREREADIQREGRDILAILSRLGGDEETKTPRRAYFSRSFRHSIQSNYVILVL